jgi:hypothetical protein
MCRWTAFPVGRFVTLPLWIPLAVLRWDPTGHALFIFGLLVVEQHLDGLDELLGFGVEESVVGLSLLRLRGGHRAAASGVDLVFGEVQRVRCGSHLRMTQKVSVPRRGICLGDAVGYLPQPPHRRQGSSFLSCDSSRLVLPTGSRIPQVFRPGPPPAVDA